EAAAGAEEAAAEPQAPSGLRRRLRGPLGWLIYLGIIVAAIILGPTVLGWALDTDHPMATISSGSMWPALKEGDVVLLRGVDSVDDVKVGDIVAFRHEGGLAIHRIVSIEGEQITTKGDANTREDEPIAFDDVIGRAVEVGGRLARVPYLGHLAELLGPVVGTATEEPGQPPQTASEGGGGSDGGGP
ncbi:MAG: signal peptidase I, partial [Chloroflexi bacterium]|nr:signal peptidase I [Chloroflexota bacterium]